MIRFVLPPSALLLLPALALAQPRPNAPKDAPPAAPSAVSLTIYSTADPATFDPRPAADDAPRGRLPGHAVVRETRRVSLPAGESPLRLSDVPAALDPTTVSVRSLTAPDSTTVLEQDFLYDAASPDKLLERYVGLPVIVNRKQEPLPGDRTRTPDTIEGRLLAFTHDQLVIETNNRQLPVQVIPRNHDISEIKLFDLKTGLFTRPTLAWRVTTDRAGDHDLRLAYHTADLTWRADYAITLDAKQATAECGAWVTIVNASGTSYADAKIRLIAGDVPRAAAAPAPEREPRRRFPAPADAAPATARPPAEQHAYPLPRPVTLANNAARQIELFPPRANLPVTRAYVYQPFPPGTNPERDAPARTVDAYLQIAADKSTDLPAGRARIYHRDPANGEQGGQGRDADDLAPVLVAEQLVPHTPKDQPLLVRIGRAPGLTADRRIVDTVEDPATRAVTESIEIKLRNPTAQPVRVVVKESLARHPQWDVSDASAKFEKTGPRTIELTTDIPASDDRTITYKAKYEAP